MKFPKIYSLLFVVIFIVTMLLKPELCFVELGIFLIFWGLFSFTIFTRIKRNGIHCLGKIVGFKGDSEGGKIPIVEFTTQSGQNIKAQPFIYTATDLRRLISHPNDETDVQLRYDPGKPDRFLLADQTGFNSFFLWLMIIVGLLFLLIGSSVLKL